jgi:hypothetical protein
LLFWDPECLLALQAVQAGQKWRFQTNRSGGVWTS